MTVFPTSNFHIPTFVVNMVKDIEKRNKIAEILDEFPMLDYKFVKAVEGKKLSTGELEVLVDMCAFKNRYGHQATLPAIGCSLSHIMIYNEAKKAQKPWLILEDDASLATDFYTQLKPIYNWLLQIDAPTVILLSPCFSYNMYRPKRFISGKSSVVDVVHGQMTSGYLLNPQAACLLSENLTPVRYLADDWDEMTEWGLNVLGVVPNLTDCPIELGEIGLSQQVENEKSDTLFNTILSKLWFRIRVIFGLRYSNRSWQK
jgi:GR25 family glycosyltransferase involved in LPS biosynthesis